MPAGRAVYGIRGFTVIDDAQVEAEIERDNEEPPEVLEQCRREERAERAQQLLAAAAEADRAARARTLLADEFGDQTDEVLADLGLADGHSSPEGSRSTHPPAP